MNIAGFIELLEFGVLVAVVTLLALAVSLCIVVIWEEMRD